MELRFEEKDFIACCGSTVFAKQMALASPFRSFDDAVAAARDIWFNQVDVNGWLEAFSAHPQIGQSASPNNKSQTSAQWSKGEQSTVMTTATESTLQELYEWNVRYRLKFGFIFIICASGRTSSEILTELKKRYPNRPIVEFQIAAEEQMKITELRLAKLFSDKEQLASAGDSDLTRLANQSEGAPAASRDRVTVISGHLTTGSKTPNKGSQSTSRTRPPITTHVLDVSQGHPAAGMEVRLEMWKSNRPLPRFGEAEIGGVWELIGSSSTDKDGRSGQLMNIVNAVNPGMYRISFNTSKYHPDGFFPYVNIVFEIRESQKFEHFHVPLLFSPFSFTTYRGS